MPSPRGLHQRLAALITRRPWTVLGLAVLGAAASLVMAWMHLEIETSRAALLSKDADYNRRYLAFRDNFEKQDDLMVVIRAKSPRAGMDFADDLGARLRADDAHFASVIERIDVRTLEPKALILLDAPEIDALVAQLRTHLEALGEIAARPDLLSLLEIVDRRMNTAVVSNLVEDLFADESSSKSENDKDEIDLDLLDAILSELSLSLDDGYRYHSPWAALSPGRTEAEERGYLTAGDERFFLVLARPKKRSGALGFSHEVVEAARGTVRELLAKHPAVSAGVTGLAALSADELSTSRADTRLDTPISAAAVLLIFLLFFPRRPLRPFLALGALLLSIAWTLGFTTLALGHLTVLSVSFGAILFGLGIDYGIHLIARFEEEARPKDTLEERLSRAFAGAGPGMIAGALTTSIALYAVLLARFRGLGEVGLIAGTGVLLALLAAFTALPAMLVLWERRRRSKETPQRSGLAERALSPISTLLDRRPRAIVVVSVALTALLSLFLPRLRFDPNLLALQAKGAESVRWEERLLEEAKSSAWYASSVADSLEEVRARAVAFSKLPTVERVASLDDLVPADQDARIERLSPLRALAKELPFLTLHTHTHNGSPSALAQRLESLRLKLGRRAQAKTATERGAMARAHRAATEAIRKLEALPDARPRVRSFERALFEDLGRRLDLLRSQSAPAPIVMDDIPSSLRERFIGRDGRLQLQVFARENVWERSAMARFLSELRTVDPEITGAAVQAYEAGLAMFSGYLRGGLFGTLAIIVVLFFKLRSARALGLALLPLVLGTVWTFGVMGLFGLPFNLANLIILPLLVGLGIDSGVHFLLRSEERGETGSVLFNSGTARATAAGALTNVAGFASLMVADHRGIASIGALLSLGLTCLLPATFLLLPAVLTVWARRDARRGPQ